ncbi:Fe-S cluster protein [Erythrobacter sp. KY5]|uniref:iron-sulfur cluster assembly scaffold protein n=1 Tax=Erythrobacter sp. KY5 TaxID=2011159 RepID=UPI000DBF0715|nr:iron-sulfur cluster assembly scaffold protein [Erythrobacter sp. KY5]AWW74764.1 Fe-S cluster protein [Erythrobacter sp. KY5]
MASASTKLYTPRLLALSAELSRFPLSETFDYRAEARSRTCGSLIVIGANLDERGQVADTGMQVTACAVGQSSAAILALSAEKVSAGAFASTLAEIEIWLAGNGPLPDWPGFDALEPALPHKGRHAALLLPWKAMVDALSSAQTPS